MSVWEFLIEELGNFVGLLKNISLLKPLGINMSLWTLLLSLFVCGTIINIITGSSDDLDD